MTTVKSLSREMKFFLLALIPIYFISVGLIIQPFDSIVTGIYEIIREPDFLITDYIAVGGMGAAFVNAGMMALISIYFVYSLGMEMDGHTITSCCLMFGFSLFGKNLMNIWAIFLGVFLYAKYHKMHLSNYIYVGIYGTSLSPIITQLMRVVELPLWQRFCVTILVGICIGFVLPPLATHSHYAHKGYSLYNVGFASGIIATVLVSTFKSFGIETEARLIWSSGNDAMLLGLLFVLFAGMSVVAVLWRGKDTLLGYEKLLATTGIGGTDYLLELGGAVTLLNMGLNGLFATFFVLAVGGNLNGPTIGGIFTIVGFSATGKHLRNIFPIMAGVCIASTVRAWDITNPSALLALLFSTTLAPIAGEFGILCGVLAGFLHASVALNVGIVYGGMNLYNNGFAGGIVAMFLVPVIQSIRDRRARAKGDLSL